MKRREPVATSTGVRTQALSDVELSVSARPAADGLLREVVRRCDELVALLDDGWEVSADLVALRSELDAAHARLSAALTCRAVPVSGADTLAADDGLEPRWDADAVPDAVAAEWQVSVAGGDDRMPVLLVSAASAFEANQRAVAWAWHERAEGEAIPVDRPGGAWETREESAGRWQVTLEMW